MIRLCALLLLPVLLAAEDRWVSIRSGPFEVFSNTGDRSARDEMEKLEQFRQGIGLVLGKQDLHLIWPVHVLLMKRPAQVTGLPMARDAYIAGNPDRKALARLLIDQNTQRLPAEIENGIIELFSTLEISGARITLGAPVPVPERTRDWARMQLLTVNPSYSGRSRVMVSNLEQGSDLDVAYKNAFEKNKTQIEKQVDDYLAAGVFATTTLSGRALNPARDFHVRQVEPEAARLALADALLAAGSVEATAGYTALHGSPAAEGLGLLALKAHKNQEALQLFESAIASGTPSARSYLEAGVLETDNAKAIGYLQKAAELNSLWSLPPYRLALREPQLDRKAILLAKAANLEPRNIEYWQALAQTYTAANEFKEAQKAWGGAERAAASAQEREHIRELRLQVQGERADFEAAERKRIAEERAQDLARVKDASMAEIHAAEDAARKKLNPEGAAPPKEVIWWSEEHPGATVGGTMQRVDCIGKRATLVIQTQDGNTVHLLVRDVAKISLVNGGEKALGCGPQKPERTVTVGYNPRIDKRLGTAGEVVSIEFR